MEARIIFFKEDYLFDPLTEHGCDEGEKRDNQVIKSTTCARGGEDLIVNDERDLVETQHAENRFSETCREFPGYNEKQINDKYPLLDSPAIRPSGQSGPNMQYIRDSLRTCSESSDDIETVDKVLITICPKGLSKKRGLQ